MDMKKRDITGYISDDLYPKSDIEVIFHYCSIGTFQKIIENRELWLTNYRAMNDVEECRQLDQWIMKWYGDNPKKLTPSAWNKFKDVYSQRLFPDIFLCCFSRNGNMLSQWRAYADDGRGVSIGFNAKSFKIMPYQIPIKTTEDVKRSISLLPLMYDVRKQKRAVYELLDKISSGPVSPGSTKNDNMYALRCFSLFMKNSGFKEEKEVRIAFAPRSPGTRGQLEQYEDRLKKRIKITGPSYRPTSDMLTPFYKLAISPSSISRIILGPQNKSDEGQVLDFMKGKGFNHFTKENIEKSRVSYIGK